MRVIRLFACAALVCAVQALSAGQAAATTCWEAVQGKIAWNYEGTTQWSPVNVDRLCGGGHGIHPAQCFQHVMHGGVNWGGSTKWEWQNAIDLCEGAHDWNARVMCFNGKRTMGWGWQKAISYCDERAYAHQACWNGLQGHVDWDYNGSTQWNPANMDRLCGGGWNMEPAACFQQVMHGGVNWGGGTKWKWQNAIDLCEGSRDAWMTVSCFQNRMAVSGDWGEAIRYCSP